jgi:hypothetical protein
MSIFGEYELEIVQSLVSPHFSSDEIDSIITGSEFVSFDYTEVGYYLTVTHPIIPKERIVCDNPLVVGTIDDGTECGFLIFLMDNELTIECYSWGDDTIPKDIRSRNVAIEIVPNPLADGTG